jgi:hypothetical protein
MPNGISADSGTLVPQALIADLHPSKDDLSMAADRYLLRTQMLAPVSLAEAFAIFEDPRNLAKITPPWMNFAITTPEPIVMKKGEIILPLGILGKVALRLGVAEQLKEIFRFRQETLNEMMCKGRGRWTDPSITALR